MTKKAIVAEKTLILGEFVADHAVIIENDLIIDLLPSESIPNDVSIDNYSKKLLVPGFIDIQVNGGGGVLFNDDPSVDTIKCIAKAHRSFGTTAFLPTLISDTLEKVEAAIAAVDEAIKQGVPGVIGIHIEGPFLNEEKSGIHDASMIRELRPKDVDLLSSLKHGKTLVTLAPAKNDHAFISELVKRGVVVAAGHTNATYEQTIDAIEAGVTGFTHLFNGMSAFQSRAPGVVGAAFESTETWAGIIADGHHVHPASLKNAINAKGVDKSVLVTDAMPTVGSEKKEFWLGREHIKVKEGKCANEDGSLAGSDLDMVSAVKYTHQTVGFSFKQALAMASCSPACAVGVEGNMGTIAKGNKANLVLLDDAIEVSKVWIEGVHYL